MAEHDKRIEDTFIKISLRPRLLLIPVMEPNIRGGWTREKKKLDKKTLIEKLIEWDIERNPKLTEDDLKDIYHDYNNLKTPKLKEKYLANLALLGQKLTK